jgi:predicted NBD/HSP70 family sugar kinase
MREITPQIVPPLDPAFRPSVLVSRAFRNQVGRKGVPLVIGLERQNGHLSRFETRIFPANHPEANQNWPYVEKLIKFLLWQHGAHTLYIGGFPEIAARLSADYAHNGSRMRDALFMGSIYEQSFRVVSLPTEDVPPQNENGTAPGRDLNGCRVGFDLGASDRKACAMMDGQLIYSEEVVWEPRTQSDPAYHYREILAAIRSAASKLPRLDAVGGSAAGIYFENQPRYASIFRSVPPQNRPQVQNLFQRIEAELGVPLKVINDGDAAALAGAISLADNGVLGLSMGSSLAAGYIDLHGQISGWLNELASAPVDEASNAPTDDLSGGAGAGSQYLSQQCIFRLAPRAGLDLPQEADPAERLAFAQEKLAAGHSGAIAIWQTLGIYLGYSLAHYADFYEIKHVLLLGRCTSGPGGSLILSAAQQVLEREFPSLANRIQIHLPDEKTRRLGQAIAAASLPHLPDSPSY